MDDDDYVRPIDLPFVARCNFCGTAYTAIGWPILKLLGPQRTLDPHIVLELRRCVCAGTIPLELAGPPTEPAPSTPNPSTPTEPSHG